MELIVATLGIIALMSYLMVNSETWVLKLVLLGLIIGGFSVLGGVGFHEDNCGFEVSNATESSKDNVDYNYNRFCSSSPSPPSLTFLKYTGWVVRILMIYIVFNLLYQLLEAMNKLPKILRRRRRAEQIRRNSRY